MSMMTRRGLLVGSCALLAPLAAGAQPARKVWRLGWLAEERDPGRASAAPGGGRWLVDALRELGYVEGQNLLTEYRFAAERADRLTDLATELIRLGVDVIAVPGMREAVAAKAATSTVPIVTLFVGDPIGAGLVPSLRSPGGNLTGTSVMYADVGGKRLEL